MQLAAVHSEDAAKSEWQRLSKRMPDLLGQRQPAFSKTEHDGRTLWRVAHRRVRDTAPGHRFCERVRAKGAGCSVAEFLKAAIVGDRRAGADGRRGRAVPRRIHRAASSCSHATSETPAQLAALIAALRRVLPPGAVLMVDQEGGRVARLRPPHWRAHPPAAALRSVRAAWLTGALIGLDCAAAGFDVVAAPVLDLAIPGAHCGHRRPRAGRRAACASRG